MGQRRPDGVKRTELDPKIIKSEVIKSTSVDVGFQEYIDHWFQFNKTADVNPYWNLDKGKTFGEIEKSLIRSWIKFVLQSHFLPEILVDELESPTRLAIQKILFDKKILPQVVKNTEN